MCQGSVYFRLSRFRAQILCPLSSPTEKEDSASRGPQKGINDPPKTQDRHRLCCALDSEV